PRPRANLGPASALTLQPRRPLLVQETWIKLFETYRRRGLINWPVYGGDGKAPRSSPRSPANLAQSLAATLPTAPGREQRVAGDAIRTGVSTHVAQLRLHLRT